MTVVRGRVQVPCPTCGTLLTFSKQKLERYGDFQIGCPSCKAIVSARVALAKAHGKGGGNAGG